MIIKQILIVDDEERLRELVQACLEDLGGWETITAGSGEECLKIVQQAKFDAIVLDVSMPGMDGFAVFEKLQANPMTQSIPVILLTARVLPKVPSLGRKIDYEFFSNIFSNIKRSKPTLPRFSCQFTQRFSAIDTMD
ncbi:response regulator [Limnofasciculus baicalensis]|uniref:Response regulator n=1 Tax=Limnofasciculus baicalensis BBK-W-15 TaxID=2699891 RepID=A0AAE3GRL6_9CYAN|nr:response regulator [Limnofasciculus baicalensis]MCP2728682.1 response regulator [Limnofasciculus baicalensis BBK-W-15]